MKNQLTSALLRVTLCTYKTLNKHKFGLSIFSLVIALSFLTGCDNDSTNSPDNIDFIETSSQSNNVHLAFAGGGWRAHSGHSAWTMSLLEEGDYKLDTIFANVGTISSNSGGSWFSTMLMYSPSFIDSIQAQDAIKSWSSLEGGWIGGQYKLFKEADCSGSIYRGYGFLPCVISATLPHYDDDAYWNLVVKDLVYSNFPIADSITLNHPTQPWAQNKPLLLAASLLTDEVVINATADIGGHDRFYQICADSSEPNLTGLEGAYCSDGDSIQVTPATFSRIPVGSNYIAPPFLSQNSAKAVFNVGYKTNGTKKSAPDTTVHITIQNPIASKNVPVITAAATSSAALGFAASEKIGGGWDASWAAEDAALSFSLADSKAQFVDAEYFTLQQMVDSSIVRIADGGAVDNSGVAQLVSSLQQNNSISDTLHIVAFDNVTDGYPSRWSTSEIAMTTVGTDIAYLFGEGLSPGNKFCAGKYCVNVPDLQIFEGAALYNTTAEWAYTDKENRLIYTKYIATTKANSVFNVSPNTTVVLHAFTCIYPTADTAPMNEKGATKLGFGAYGDMIQFIHTGLGKQGGLHHLQKALGINK